MVDFRRLIPQALRPKLKERRVEFTPEELEFIAGQVSHRGEVTRMTKRQIVICFVGMPYSGKSTLLKALAPSLGAAPLEEERIRLDVDDSGLSLERTTMILMELARAFLDKGQNVAMDCDFTRQETRKAVERLASGFKARVVYIAVECDLQVITKRLIGTARADAERRLADDRVASSLLASTAKLPHFFYFKRNEGWIRRKPNFCRLWKSLDGNSLSALVSRTKELIPEILEKLGGVS